MNIISHIQEMLAKATPSAYVALGIAAFCGVLVLLGALKGLTRGILRQTVRFVSIIISIVIAYLLANGITAGVLGFFEGKTLEQALAEFGFFNDVLAEMDEATLAIINGLNPATVQMVLAFPLTLIIAPIVFVLEFILTSFFMRIVHAIVSGACGFTKRRNNIWTRLGGMALGAVQGFLVAAVVLVPFTGLFGMVSDTVALIERPEEGEEVSEAEASILEVVDMYDEYLADVIESPVLKLVNFFGGNIISDQLSTVKINGTKTNTKDTVPHLVEIGLDVVEISDIDVTDITAEDEAAIRAIIDKIMDEPLTATLIVEGFHSAANAVEAGVIPLDDIPAPFDEVVASAIGVYKNSTVQTVKSDFNTICDVFFIIARSGLLNSEDLEGTAVLQIIGAPEDENVILLIFDALASNSNFDTLITTTIVKIADAFKSEEENMFSEMLDEMFAEDDTFKDAFLGVIDVLASTSGVSDLREDIKALTDIVGLIKDINFEDENADYITLLLSSEGEEDSIVIAALKIFEGSRFSGVVLDAAKALLQSSELTDSMDDQTKTFVEPFLNVFTGDDVTMASLIEDLEAVQGIVLEVYNSGIIDAEDSADIMAILFEKQAGSDETFVESLVGMLDGTDFADALVEVYKALAEKNEDGEYVLIAGEEGMVVAILEPVFEVIGGTATFAEIKSDIGVIADVMAALAETGIFNGDEELDYMTLLFEAEEGEDSVVITILNILAGSRFDDAILSAVKTVANDPEVTGSIDDSTREFVQPFLDVLGGDDITIESLIADIEAIQEIIVLLDGMDAFDDENILIALFVAEGENDPLISVIIEKLEGTDFEGPLVEAYQALAKKDEAGNYVLLGESEGIVGAVVGPLLDVIGATASYSDIEGDIACLSEVISLLSDAGIFGEGEIDYMTVLFTAEGESDSIMVQILKTLGGDGSRFGDAIIDAFAAVANDPAVTESLDDTTREFVQPFLNVFGGDGVTIESLIEDVEAIQEIIVLLDGEDAFGDGNVLVALFVAEGEGTPLISTIIETLEGTDFEEPLVEAYQALAKKDEAGNYVLLGEEEGLLTAVVGPLLDVIATTDDYTDIEGDVECLSAVIVLLNDAGVFGEGEIDYMTVLFTAEEGEDSVIVSVLREFDKPNSRFGDAVVDAFAAVANDPSVTESLDGAMANFVQPFLNIFDGDDVTISDIIADIEAIQDIIVLLDENGILDSEDAIINLFLIKNDAGDSLIEQIIAECEGTDLEDALVESFKSLAEKEDGKYVFLADTDEFTSTLVGPLLEELGNTASFAQLQSDVELIAEAVEILNAEGVFDEGADLDLVTLLFGQAEDEGTDSVLIRVLDVFAGTRFDEPLATSIASVVGDELDTTGADPTYAVIMKAMFNLLDDVENIADIKADIDALSDVIGILELSDDGDMLALLTKDASGLTPIEKAIDEFTTPELQDFLLEVITGLAGGVVNFYDGEEATAGEIEIELDGLVEPTLSFIIATMEVFEGITTIDQLDRDVATLANIVEILDNNGLVADEEIDVDVITLFTEPVLDENDNVIIGADGEPMTVIDQILAEFESNNHLNPVLLALTKSMAENIELVNVGAPFDMLVASVADVFQRSTADTVVDDVQTVADVFVILKSKGVLEENAPAVAILSERNEETGTTIVDDIVAILKSNPNTTPIVTDFTKISLSLIVQNQTQAGADGGATNTEEIEQTYEDTKVEIDNVVTGVVTDINTRYDLEDEEQKQEAVTEVSGLLNDALNNALGSGSTSGGEGEGEGGEGGESGGEVENVVDQEIVDSMAEFVVNEYGDKTMDDLINEGLYVPTTDENGDVVTDEDGNIQYEISDEAMTNVILNYYEAYLKAQQN